MAVKTNPRNIVARNASAQNQQLYLKHHDTPLGEMLSACTDDDLYLLGYCDSVLLKKQLDELKRSFAGCANRSISLNKKLDKQLQEYFRGKRKSFDIPVCFIGTTFENKAWRALTRIPYGQTISYKEQAQRLGNPKAFRAAGNANRKNKISIVIPCHRVIGSHGKLIGYGGGLTRKEQLLELENRV